MQDSFSLLRRFQVPALRIPLFQQNHHLGPFSEDLLLVQNLGIGIPTHQHTPRRYHPGYRLLFDYVDLPKNEIRYAQDVV